jgi:hypothetical protein
MTHCICCVVKPTILNQNCDDVSRGVQNLRTSKQAGLHAFLVSTPHSPTNLPQQKEPLVPSERKASSNRHHIYLNIRQLLFIIFNFQENAVGYATTNECYNEQFLSIKSGCYNNHRYYNERGGILSAEVACVCT